MDRGDATLKKDRVTWVTIRRFSHPSETHADVILLPDIHVAEEVFHWEMKWEIRDVDVVLAETSRAPFKKVVMFVYRITAKLSKLDTVTKSSKRKTEVSDLHGAEQYHFETKCHEHDNCVQKSTKFIKADLTHEESKKLIKDIGWMNWIGFIGFMFFGGLWVAITDRDGLKSSEVLRNNESPVFEGLDENMPRWLRKRFAKLKYYLCDAREDRVLEILKAEIETGEHKKIAIGYGAGHMARFIQELEGVMGYECIESRKVAALIPDGISLSDFEAGYGHAVRRVLKDCPETVQYGAGKELYESSVVGLQTTFLYGHGEYGRGTFISPETT